MKETLGLIAMTLAATTLLSAQTTVDTFSDGDDGECAVDCTLREAIATAAAGELIQLPSGTYGVSLGEIEIDRDLTLAGAGARQTIVAMETTRRIFIIQPGARVTVRDMTLTHAHPGGFGAGIFNQGELLLQRAALVGGSSPTGLGGGLQNNGTAVLEDCLIARNASEFGGGVFSGFSASASTTLTNCTVSDNGASFGGGGMQGTGIVLNSTTVTGNRSELAGAGGVEGEVTLRNSIVADHLVGPDCAGTVDATPGHNLDSDGSCTSGGGEGNLTAPALLGPLADNGGPTDTHLPDSLSAAIDAGNPSEPGGPGDACPVVDQRGVSRPQGVRCDIGAVEVQETGCAGGPSDDADGDGVCDAEDNCPQGFNPDQGPAPFGRTVLAASVTRFEWGEPVDVMVVRGDLVDVSDYGVDQSHVLNAATGVDELSTPEPGAGFWLLARLSGACSVPSWQTTSPADGDRDGALP